MIKSKKAQFEVEPIPILMGVFGGILSWIMAGSMGAGVVMKIITVLATAVVCYFIASLISNK